MNAKYFAALTTIVLATGFSQPLTHAQAPQLVLTSIFSNEPPPPPDQGAPGDRTGAGTRLLLWSDAISPESPLKIEV